MRYLRTKRGTRYNYPVQIVNKTRYFLFAGSNVLVQLRTTEKQYKYFNYNFKVLIYF